jgi:hypothetical protein
VRRPRYRPGAWALVASLALLKWHYLTTVEEAREFAPEAEVGGEWELPEGWP